MTHKNLLSPMVLPASSELVQVPRVRQSQSQSSLQGNSKGQKSTDSSQQEEGACGRARLQQHQDFNKLGALQTLQPASHHQAKQHQGPHPEGVSWVPQDTAPQAWTPFPTTCIWTKCDVPPRAGSLLRCQQEACGYQVHGDIYHNI